MALLGVGKGVFGLALRPTFGILEMTSKASYGMGLVCLGRCWPPSCLLFESHMLPCQRPHTPQSGHACIPCALGGVAEQATFSLCHHQHGMPGKSFGACAGRPSQGAHCGACGRLVLWQTTRTRCAFLAQQSSFWRMTECCKLQAQQKDVFTMS